MVVVKWQDLEKLIVSFGYITIEDLEANQLDGLLINTMYPKGQYGGI